MGWTIPCLFLLGSIFESISPDERRHRREQEPLISGVEQNNLVREDSIVNFLFFSLTVAWISGRDPLLVVSVVMSRGFPQIRICLFFFWHHHDIMHHITLNILQKKNQNIILTNLFLFCKLI